ncbi:ABC transporter permease [Longirhabdus pacifica]|uniref:ABC transporter permease n=1 Tax=Longirhabdus pacifica TaxID=2305227 RepID=UPI001008FB87|nr:ABC transporter permease [Longirhabdus pacifica]
MGNGIYGIWLRDMKKFFRVRSHFISSIVRPMLWLLIMGGGLKPIVQPIQGVDYIQYIFAGIVSMSIIFAAMQSAISIVWDREFGYLKEILVSPVPRTAVVLGKACSGSTIATLQGALTFIFLPFIGLSIPLLSSFYALIAMFIIGFSIATLGIVIAGKLTSFESFGSIVNFLLLPMFFLSGAVYPIPSAPTWLTPLLYMNPLTYGVDLLRYILLDQSTFSPLVNLSVLLAFSAVMLSIAIPLFKRES